MGKLSKKNRKNKDKPEEAKVVDDVPQEDAPTEPEKPKVTPMEVEETEKKPDSESDDEEVKEEPAKKIYDKADERKTIFVGNLPVSTKRSHLSTYFGGYGAIKTIRFRSQTGAKIYRRSEVKNDPFVTAFVVFQTEEAARKATKATCGQLFREAHIRVTMAGGKKGASDGKRTIFVGNLKYTCSDNDLFEVFEHCGEIEYVRTLRNKMGCIGIAYVCFKRPESLSLAMELNGTVINDRPCRVERYKAKPKTSKVEKDEKKPKEVTRFINGKAVKVKIPPNNGPKKEGKGKGKIESGNRNNALKRLEKKAPLGDKAPFQKSDKEGRTPEQRRKFFQQGKNKKKPRSTQNMKLAKTLNPNLKKKANKPKAT